MHVEERQVWATPDSSHWRGAHMQHGQRLLPSLTDTCLLLQTQAEQFHWYYEYPWYPMNWWYQWGTCSVPFLTFPLPKAHCSQEIINTLKSHNQICNLYPAGLIDTSLQLHHCLGTTVLQMQNQGAGDWVKVMLPGLLWYCALFMMCWHIISQEKLSCGSQQYKTYV